MTALQIRSGRADRRTPWQRFVLRTEPYLYCAPALTLIVAIMLVPLVVGLSYAFRDLTLLDPMSGDYIGFDHFRDIWADANFWNALRNTVIWTVSSVALQFGFGLVLALLLNRPFPGRSVVQAMVFLPWAVPSFLSGLNWAWLFNPVVGPLPYWFQALGLMTTPDNLLSDPAHALWGPILAMVWWGIPFFAITLLAALQSIPRDIYEAAAMDGAGAIRRFQSITLPFLAPTIAITILLRTVWISQFGRPHRRDDPGWPRRFHSDHGELHLHPGVPAARLRLCVGAVGRAAGAAARLCVCGRHAAADAASSGLTMRPYALRRTASWVLHYGLLAFYVAFALFPLFWLFKVSVTPKDLLYSEGVRLWPSQDQLRTLRLGDPAHGIPAVLPQQRDRVRAHGSVVDHLRGRGRLRVLPFRLQRVSSGSSACCWSPRCFRS